MYVCPYYPSYTRKLGFIKIFKLVSEDVHDVTSQKCGCVNRIETHVQGHHGFKSIRSLQSGKTGLQESSRIVVCDKYYIERGSSTRMQAGEYSPSFLDV